MNKLTPELCKTLTDFAASINMSPREVAQYMEMIAKREEILSKHTIPITQGKDGRFRTRTPKPDNRQIVKTKREDLEDALIAYYVSLQPSTMPIRQEFSASSKQETESSGTPANDCTLKTIYPLWLPIRKSEVNSNTLIKDIRHWETYIEPSDIADVPLQQLRRSQLKAWANGLIKEYAMKRKYFNNVKTVLNSLLDFAVDEDYIANNHLRNLKINSRLFKPDDIKKEHEEAFTHQEQELIIKEAELDSLKTSSAIPLGICILFYTGLRVGELCGLKYGDIHGNYLYVKRMVIENTEETDDGLKRNGYKIIEHTKSAAGQRQIPLTQTARDYFERIKKLNQQNGLPTSEDDIIFQRDGTICNQRVFDCRIHKYCNPEHLHLSFYKSCHDIRRTYISRLLDSGINPDTVRRIAGHEDIEMTMKYCRGCEERHELEAILEQAFSN